MKMNKPLLVVAACLLMATCAQAAPVTVTMYATQDVGYSAGDTGTGNTGKDGYMNADLGWGGRRFIVQWDLSSIPVGSTITSAVAKIHRLDTVIGQQFSVYALSEVWTEGYGMSNGGPGVGHVASGANWKYREIENSLEWSTLGGSYDASTRVQFTGEETLEATGMGTWAMRPDVTAIVQSWVNGTRANDGLIFTYDGGYAGRMAMLQRDYGYPDDGQDRPGPGIRAPHLEITYTAPPVPEPATMSLLALGGLAALIRRGRK